MYAKKGKSVLSPDSMPDLSGLEPPCVSEGKTSEWICLDYTGVVIHVLLNKGRDFYQIERLWEDGEKIDIEDLIIKE